MARMAPSSEDFEGAQGSDVRPSADDLAQLFVGPEYRERFAPRGTERAFHVSVYPSFGDYVGYELLSESANGDDAWLLARRAWQRPRETPGARGASAVAPIARATAVRWLTTLRGFDAPLAIVDSIGVDGTLYEIAIGHYLTSLRLRWWSKGPKPWAPLTAWARTFLEEVGALGGWEPLPPGTGRDGVVSAWVVLPPTGAGAPALRALRELAPSLADVSLAGLRERSLSPEGVALGEMPWPLARALRTKANSRGLHVELRSKTR
jgi:hypothetical protein